MSGIQKTQPIKGDAYDSAVSSLRWAVTHQTPGTNIIGQTSFVSTTPTFLIRLDGTASDPQRLILSSFELWQAGTVAGSDVTIAVALDTRDRFSSGGDTIAFQFTNTGNDDPTFAATFLTNPTCTAEDSSFTRYIYTAELNETTGEGLVVGTRDAWMLEQVGSILVYTFATATAPSWKFTFEGIEEDA